MVPTMIHAQGTVEYPDIFTLCSSFDPVEDPIPGSEVPGGGPTGARWVTAGHYDHIVVDDECYISAGAIVNGKVFEPHNTAWSIYVDASAEVKGDIKEKGAGDVRMTVGQEGTYNGNVKEKGPGDVHLWIDGVFSGKVQEMGEGSLRIDVFGDAPSAGPGTFEGKAAEEGSGDATLVIEAPGDYDGNFREEGPGECYARIELPDEQPRGRIMCSPVNWVPW